jgi:hypothetical protein
MATMREAQAEITAVEERLREPGARPRRYLRPMDERERYPFSSPNPEQHAVEEDTVIDHVDPPDKPEAGDVEALDDFASVW